MIKTFIKNFIERINELEKKRKIILILIIGLILILIFYQIFSNSRKTDFELFEVTKGNIIQEIFETGQVQKGERINLSFKSPGQVEQIYVQVGDQVNSGQELAVLNYSDFEFQLQEALASLELAQINLNKILIGASDEEREISQAQLNNAQVSLDSAEKNLENSYQSGLSVLDGSVASIYSALQLTRDLIRDYVVVYDSDAQKMTQARDQIEAAEARARQSLSLARNTLTNNDIENAILTVKSSLETCFNGLETIDQTINGSVFYRDIVSATDKTSLTTLKTTINTALTSVLAADQSISSMKASLESAEKSFQEAESRFNLVTGKAKQIDIDLHQAQIKQAQARVSFYQNQIKQSKLVSPIKGKVVEIKKREGEIVQPTSQDPIIVILPLVPYEIKVDIYEGDVVKINPGDSVEISLVALPKQTFQGKIISINPAEKIIDKVVYYEIFIGFENVLENLMPGMTADIVIKVNFKKDVLVVHRDAIQRKNGRRIVELFKNNLIEEKEIEIGSRGIDNMEEIVSGLNQGDKVLIRQ
jgi:HlyD family secretion protein